MHSAFFANAAIRTFGGIGPITAIQITMPCALRYCFVFRVSQNIIPIAVFRSQTTGPLAEVSGFVRVVGNQEPTRLALDVAAMVVSVS